ncbi:MAG: thioredoxin [Acidobacteriota bacterium]
MIFACPSCSTKNRLDAARLHETAHCGKCKTPISPLTSPLVVDSAASFDEVVGGSPLPVVVDFWAEWCGPCRMMAPELEKLAALRAGRLVVAKVDTDALPEVAGRYGFQAIPTLILFAEGRELRRTSGARNVAGIARDLDL